MNAKTAKLIRKYAAAHNYSPAALKRQWNATPWNQRHAIRKEMEAKIK